jgi:hypothetical protein
VVNFDVLRAQRRVPEAHLVHEALVLKATTEAASAESKPTGRLGEDLHRCEVATNDELVPIDCHVDSELIRTSRFRV